MDIRGKNSQAQQTWIVVSSLQPKSKETCQGSLISDQWVLTAAHCFHDTQMEDRHLWRVNVGKSGAAVDPSLQDQSHHCLSSAFGPV